MTNQTPLTGELNFIISYFFNGCRTPITGFAECALPFAGEVALVLIGYDWQDITTAFFRPKGLRSARHGRKSAKRRKGGGIPQIPDLIAEHCPTIEEFSTYVVTDQNKIWWKIESTIERITWEIALIELTTDFAYKSLLGVLKLKATKCAVPGRASTSSKEWDPFNNGQYYAIPIETIDYEEYPVTVTKPNIQMENGDYYQIMVEVTAFNRGQESGSVDLQIWIQATDGGGIFATGWIELGPGSSTSNTGAFIVKGPGFVRVEQASHGEIAILSCNMSVVPSAFTT